MEPGFTFRIDGHQEIKLMLQELNIFVASNLHFSESVRYKLLHRFLNKIFLFARIIQLQSRIYSISKIKPQNL